MHHKMSVKVNLRNHLIRTAKDNAKARGHILGTFDLYGLNRAYANCLCCNCWIQINTNPSVNEIDIAGTAIALQCEE